MIYRMIVTLLLCFMLAACAGTPPLPAAPDEKPLVLPEGFIGTWDYSPAYAAVDIIRPNGIIESRSKETGETLETSEYRVIYVENPRSVYILVKDRINKPELTNYEYIHLVNRLIYDKKTPERVAIRYSCYTNEKEWQQPRAILEKRVTEHKQYDCDITTYMSALWHYERFNP